MKTGTRCQSLRSLGIALLVALAFSGLTPSPVKAQAPVLGQGEQYLILRDEHIARLRGLPYDKPDARVRAIEEMERQEALQAAEVPALSSSTWASIGPAPIPNGQTTPSTPVSGRVSAIAVHPTNPNTVYVGAAQGGVYRSLDGGATWTPIFDNAQSLAIGAIAIAPSDPTTVFVGTGEANFSCDSFFGVGVYRITNADTQPVLAGPFNRNGSSVDVMTGRSISQIVVHPTDANTLFVSTTSGFDGIGCGVFLTLPNRGLFRSTNALGTTPTFTKLTVASAGDDRSITDLAMEPGTPNNLLAVVRGANVAGDGGVYRSTNALAATPSFTQRLTFLTADARGLFAINKIGSTVTVLVASGESSGAATCGTGGTLRRSTDGGQSWLLPIAAANGFCGGQCFYDIAVAIDPTNASNILLGGSVPAPTCSKLISQSTTAGSTFFDVSAGVHADNHVVVIAPSNPMTAYLGTDGGIYKSTDGGATWTSMNTATFNATQFQSLALHPSDREFMIGGTQDNGTELKRADGTWTRADFGDGGFALIDRNATDTTNVTMYHTYFNQTNGLIGFARVNTSACATSTATTTQWSFKGIYTGPVDPTVLCDGTTDTFNGISITDPVLFYAPMALGPGTPNTVYFGTDKLYRSTNKGDTMTVVSQVFAAGVEVSAIGISPQNDNVRIVGLRNGKVFRTTTGANPLTNVSGPIPAFSYIARAVIDPNNVDTAYVTLAEYGHPGQQIWKTTNLSNASPTWVASSAGIPDVPINAFAVDPANSNMLFAGTDIGVYRSVDGGASWFPFGAGLPRVAVFDMAIQNTFRVLRIATHGRGIWEISLLGDTTTTVAAVLPLSRSVQVGGAQATAFAAIINAGAATAVNCAPAPPSSPPAGLGPFTYQTTSSANALIGTPNTPANIAPGALQNYVFGFSPTGPIAETSLAMRFICDNAAAPQFQGVNNFFIVASTSPVPDPIALISTISGDGVVRIASSSSTQLFAIGTSNVGATGTIVVSGDDGGAGLPLALTVCETTGGSTCLAPPTPTVTVNYLAGTNRSFAFFAQATGSIPFDPANKRVFARLREGSVLRGATSAAVCTIPNAGC